MRIVRVTTTDFELEDGRIYQHPVPLEKAPSLKQFQAGFAVIGPTSINASICD